MLPREKMKKFGMKSLNDEELISILIGSGVKGYGLRKISKRIKRVIFNNGFSEGKVLNELRSIKGVGEVKAIRLVASLEFGERRLVGRSAGKKIVSSEDAYRVIEDIGWKEQEFAVGIYLNSSYELIERRVLSIGQINCVGITPREILAPVFELNANALIFAHNHPSGSILPSSSDNVFTKRVI
ncbi:MAG TPA: DNA repair protein RadC, partial [bacterium]|nr:DNA repair protein RadC [bacterium]